MVSVGRAWHHSQGPFSYLRHNTQGDHKGEQGRSRTRNRGVQENSDADWLMFIDADDLCQINAFELFGHALAHRPQIDAVFGAIKTDRHGIIDENVYPLDWPTLIRRGAHGTLSMGCFVRREVAEAVPFNEDMDQAEDFDFYLRLLDGRHWTKLKEPLVLIRRNVGNAGGPRGMVSNDWRGACQKVVDRYST